MKKFTKIIAPILCLGVALTGGLALAGCKGDETPNPTSTVTFEDFKDYFIYANTDFSTGFKEVDEAWVDGKLFAKNFALVDIFNNTYVAQQDYSTKSGGLKYEIWQVDGVSCQFDHDSLTKTKDSGGYSYTLDSSIKGFFDEATDTKTQNLAVTKTVYDDEIIFTVTYIYEQTFSDSGTTQYLTNNKSFTFEFEKGRVRDVLKEISQVNELTTVTTKTGTSTTTKSTNKSIISHSDSLVKLPEDLNEYTEN